MMEVLDAEFPFIGFILYGISSNVSQAWTHAFTLVQEEINMAQSIIGWLDLDVRILNSINCSDADGGCLDRTG